MAIGDGFTSEFLTGLAELLDTEGVGAWDPSAAYAADDIGITLYAIIPTPDRLITLAEYPLSGQTPGMQDYQTGLQVRTRGIVGDPRDCDDIADSVFNLIDSCGPGAWGTATIVDAERLSYTALGFDANGRKERSDNYAVRMMRATANRTD